MQIKYKLSFPEPNTHYAEVEMQLSGLSSHELHLKMAVWTPGSYLIREYAKNIDFVEANGERLQKTDKNTWKLDTKNQSQITVRYRTYCFEYSVRTNWVDDQHALIIGAATFLYVSGFENTESEIHIQPYASWKNISTSLPEKEDKWIRIAKNLDELIDSPIEIGNHASYFFEVENVTHELAVYGNSNGSMDHLMADLEDVIAEEIKIFGAHPCKNYVFILHHTDNSFGGLEHLYSSVNFVARRSYEPKKYQQVISLLAHEYFHLWNVKRIRPRELGPFDYSNENYTQLLWFFEGITSYYDDYICFRAGITEQDDYIEIVQKNINDVINMPGIDTQTLAESSFDAWIKYYRKNENTANTQVNYYTKGAVVGLIFDFIIMDATEGAKSMDDVLRMLFERYNADPLVGITEPELLHIFNLVSGIDFAPYFQKFIHSTGLEDIESYFDLAGIRLKDNTDHESYFLGISTDWKNERLVVTALDKNYGAYKGGLYVNDEIIAIDGYRVMKDFWKIYAHKKANDTVKMLISREGAIKTVDMTLTQDNRKSYTLTFPQNISTRQSVILKRWLNE